MHTLKGVLTSGFAMFAMFFGSGNLIFPIAVGVHSESSHLYGMLGLALTGVLVPFIGALSMMLYKGDRLGYFNSLGNRPALLLMLMMLCLMSPFGVAARCILVSFEGFRLLFPNLMLVPFAIGYCILVGLCLYRQNRFITLIGKWLTPLLLASIAILFVGAYLNPVPLNGTELTRSMSFVHGLKEGYNTMDLLAAFFFSSTLFVYLKEYFKTKRDSEIVPIAITASIFGMGLLTLVYFGFVYMGAHYAGELAQVSTGQYLVHLSGKVLGRWALPVSTVLISLACLTTMITLVHLFADFCHKHSYRIKITRPQSIVGTLILCFITSLLGFDSLARFLAIALEVVYPALILFALGNLLQKAIRFRKSSHVFWIALALSVGTKMIH